MAEKLPRWVKDPRELGMIAQWPEDWRTFHEHGLEWILSSGRIDARLFAEPLGSNAMGVLGLVLGRDETRPWIEFVTGRLLAGVGAELLLKGLYMKRGFSIRTPETSKSPLARLGSPESQRLNPRMSASFGVLLHEDNLKLLGAGLGFRALMVAKWWRDQAAHAAVTMTGDAGPHLFRLALALRGLHDELLRNAGAEHVARIEHVLRATRPAIGGGERPRP